MNKVTAIPFGIVVGDGKNYTVEVTSVDTVQKHSYEKRRLRGPHYHDRYKKCCWKGTTKSNHKIKIISRYSHSFVKSLGIAKPGNHRNHATITRFDMQVHDEEDINRVIAYVNVMEDQIKKDVKESLLTKKLVKRTADEIYELKHKKYPNMFMRIHLNSPSGEEELLNDEQEHKEPTSPDISTARMKKKYNV